MAANDPSASFGELLRDHRHAASLTQEELAERAGVSPRSVSEWERGGPHVPRRDTVALLIRALGLAGADREAFEALVDHRRQARPRPTPAATPLEHLPPSDARAVERSRHNLPLSLTSFVGRQHDLRELARVLPSAPLLTLVGAGGVGKTRLAQELVREHLATFADGCWLVELAGLADPTLLPGAVAAAVGLRDMHGRDLTQTLTDYLKPKQLVLVLDNCEHLIEACAALVAHLLRVCPRLQVVATSREPLAITGEITWRVPPLELPDLQQPQSLAEISATAAVRLFVERAVAVNHTLTLTDANAPAIARICIGVDGIPLALELAAARVRVLTVEELAERLEYDFAVLGRTNRAGLPQHQTIRATIDWSYDLLAEPEQVLLRRLAVFAGGWTLPMAEMVCAGGGIEPDAMLDLLTQLVDKSMVLVDARDAEARYRLLEPIRQYALERLAASGEATAYGTRHAAAFLEFAETGDADPAGPHEISALDALEVEHDNIRAALRWALDHQDGELALRGAGAMFRFWERQGLSQEGRAWLEQALAGADDAPVQYRARALNALANFYWRGGDPEGARPLTELALALSRQAGDTRGIAWAYFGMGMIAYFLGEPALAVARLEECASVAREGGHPSLQSLALTFIGRTLLWSKGPLHPRAAAALDESLALAVEAQSRYATGHALMTLGDLVWQQGDGERAVPFWRQALEMRWQLADRRGIASCLERLAWGLAAIDQFEPAAWLFGAAEAQHTELGMPLRHDEEPYHTRLVAATRQQLGEAFARTWSAGQASSVDDAIGHALEDTRFLPSEQQRATAGYARRARGKDISGCAT